jgi:hypothetical protein
MHWYPWYPDKWFGSIMVRGMSLEERGAYHELLDWQWQGGGYLPAELGALSRVVGFDVGKFPQVLEKFPVVGNRRANKTLLTIWQEQERKRSRKRGGSTAVQVDDAFVAQLRELYSWVDIDAEIIKMRGWLMSPKGAGRKFTRQFVVNWLNRNNKPLSIGTGKPERKMPDELSAALQSLVARYRKAPDRKQEIISEAWDMSGKFGKWHGNTLAEMLMVEMARLDKKGSDA